MASSRFWGLSRSRKLKGKSLLSLKSGANGAIPVGFFRGVLSPPTGTGIIEKQKAAPALRRAALCETVPMAPKRFCPRDSTSSHRVRVTGSVQPARIYPQSLAGTNRSPCRIKPGIRFAGKRATRKPAAACPSRGGFARAAPPDETAWPRRQSARRTSCQAAIRPCSRPAAPTSPAGQTC